MTTKIRAVLFDLGDTLLQFGPIDRDALFKEAAWRTYQLWASRQDRMPGFQRYYLHQWFALRWGYLKLMLLGRERDVMRMIRRACRKLWLSAPEEFYPELAWEWYRPLAEIARVEPGTHELLADLRDRGYRLGIISNTFVPGFVLDRHLTGLGLIEFFPERIYSCDVGYRKPHRRIFEIALERIGVRPDEAIFVGDLPEVDLFGAYRMGMTPIWKRSAADRRAVPAGTLAIDRLSELREKIAQIEAFAAQPRALSA